MKNLFSKWEQYKVGDMVYYTGFYGDCFTPEIDLKSKYEIISTGEKGRVQIKLGDITHDVYRCELSTHPRGSILELLLAARRDSGIAMTSNSKEC